MSIGVGTTDELGLRVSVASLARVVFNHPQQAHTMLALERKATLRDTPAGPRVTVTAQPFGGAVRLRGVTALREAIGSFHFDSHRSRAEGDFRIQIRPANWARLRRFCLDHLWDGDEAVLESGPERELAEEFADALQVRLTSSQYRLKRMGLMIENAPAGTNNVHAVGRPTVRIYDIFEVSIVDPSLASTLLANSEQYANGDLQALALQDASRGGKGRANAVLALPLRLLTHTYLAMSPAARNAPVTIAGHHLDGNVPALLQEIDIPRFERV